jgi:dihydropteroate synthase
MIPSAHQHTVRDTTISFANAHIMGILNCTPDSFSDGGQFSTTELALNRIEEMVDEGATFIDVGGESTRPGSDPVSVDEELRRITPVLRDAIPRFPNTTFSIDTTKYEVAKAALDLGVHYVNDVSGLRKEPRFTDLCATYNAGLILMHSIGDPKNMQENPQYSDVVAEVRDYLINAAEIAQKAGISAIVIDPGIGFGKTLDHNTALLKGLHQFTETGFPVLIGVSRKSMVGQILGNRPTGGRLAGTIAAHYFALQKGANILRVHDVQEAHDSLQIHKFLG